MIVPDVNLLIYAFNADASHHRQAVKWWENCVNGGEIVGLPWVVLQGFVRLLSNRTVLQNPYSTMELFKICDEWFDLKVVTVLEPSLKTYKVWRDLMMKEKLPGTLSTDALIAASALENEATVHSNDGDFSRFPGLKFVNPLEKTY